jgi:hypothetical protein
VTAPAAPPAAWCLTAPAARGLAPPPPPRRPRPHPSLQGDLSKGGKLHHTSKLEARPDISIKTDFFQITALAFAPLPAAAAAAAAAPPPAPHARQKDRDALWLFAATEAQTLAFNVADGSKNILDQAGLHAGRCAALKGQVLVVARDDALYDYTVETRAGCTVFDGALVGLGARGLEWRVGGGHRGHPIRAGGVGCRGRREQAVTAAQPGAVRPSWVRTPLGADPTTHPNAGTQRTPPAPASPVASPGRKLWLSAFQRYLILVISDAAGAGAPPAPPPGADAPSVAASGPATLHVLDVKNKLVAGSFPLPGGVAHVVPLAGEVAVALRDGRLLSFREVELGAQVQAGPGRPGGARECLSPRGALVGAGQWTSRRALRRPPSLPQLLSCSPGLLIRSAWPPPFARLPRPARRPVQAQPLQAGA